VRLFGFTANVSIAAAVQPATAASLALLPASACGQSADDAADLAMATVDADPALWVAKDADTTIYLFGTVHVLKPGLTWFDEAVKTAFDSSDQVVMEIVQPEDQAAVQALIFDKGMSPAGPTLTEKLPADMRDAYAKVMTTYGMPTTAFDRMDPWLAAVTLTMVSLAKLGYQPDNGPEKVLTAAAQEAGKPVVGLETIEQQFGYLDSMSQDAQLAMLTSTIDETEEAGEMFAEMVSDWSKGDDKALAELMNDGFEDSPELRRVMLTTRNARWADWIDARMDKPGTAFIAVGAGHLAGPDSVQADLAKHGIAVTRVDY
jgi:uncharacterized protein YbaP (TraB family)